MTLKKGHKRRTLRHWPRKTQQSLVQTRFEGEENICSIHFSHPAFSGDLPSSHTTRSRNKNICGRTDCGRLAFKCNVMVTQSLCANTKVLRFILQSFEKKEFLFLITPLLLYTSAWLVQPNRTTITLFGVVYSQWLLFIHSYHPFRSKVLVTPEYHLKHLLQWDRLLTQRFVWRGVDYALFSIMCNHNTESLTVSIAERRTSRRGFRSSLSTLPCSIFVQHTLFVQHT